MGQLMTLAEAKSRLGVEWYFENHGYFSPAALPDPAFPHQLCIYRDVFNDLRDSMVSNRFRIAMRRWIERNLTGVVLHEYKDMNYWYRPRRAEGGFHEGYNVTHGYHIFHFEDENDALLFKFQYPEITSTTMEKYQADRIPTDR